MNHKVSEGTDRHQNSVVSAVMDRRAIPTHAVESRWKAADGHAIRRIDWPGSSASGDTDFDSAAGARGSILFFPGRGDNYEKYLETLEHWHRAGWRVTASDWRGQAGSGRYGDDAVTGHIPDFSIWVDDLAKIWQAWIKETPGPHILAGHSMGGHVLMRALIEERVRPDAMFLCAPMIQMSGPSLPLWVLHLGARLMTLIGNPKRQAWKWSERPGELPKGRNKLLTHDAERYADEVWWREKRPELAMGPGSWGWVERAYASGRVVEAAGAMEKVQTPVFIISTDTDKLVSHEACQNAAARLPQGELLVFGEETRHEILREMDEIRDPALAAVSDFFDRVAPRADPAIDA